MDVRHPGPSKWGHLNSVLAQEEELPPEFLFFKLPLPFGD